MYDYDPYDYDPYDYRPYRPPRLGCFETIFGLVIFYFVAKFIISLIVKSGIFLGSSIGSFFQWLLDHFFELSIFSGMFSIEFIVFVPTFN